MNRLKKAILVVVFALLMIYPINNFLEIKEAYFPEKSETEQGISYINNLAQADVKEVQKAVDIAEEIRNYVPESKAERVKKLLEKLDAGKISYRKAFRKVYIMGDSLMNGLESYDILNPARLITQVSASLYHLADNMEVIKQINPPVLILHYGVNMIGDDGENLKNFIAMYSRLIRELRSELPDTRIIVSALFPVDRKIASADRFGNIKAYNLALKNMCKQTGVDFLSNAALFREIEYSYGKDGIHLSSSFYTQWLRYVIEKMEIV